ncbi:hypothetical protein AUI06_05715 [archaeon 13_2_20CM_2_52_21]|nr:MAG: hypothetical protein AUI06_05715 [archaeon 13_2_20CM_2_52_21]OLD09064.1 MAG: hypothetical protein AUI95_01695 [Crenarchaeota archaeon 13_1_40CM_3_52_4]OLD44129.1 MAG: hypothetical protein AUI51_03630 [archaeon 13_1_40CM_2_52_4]
MRLTIEEYGPWVSKELDNQLRSTRSKAAKLVEEAKRAISEAESFYEDLAKKGDRDMATKKDAASYRAARLIGHGAHEAAARVKEAVIPNDTNWESLKIVKDNLSVASRSIRDLRDSTARELSGFYILDMRSFGGTLDRIAKSGERLASFLDGEGSKLQRARTMTGILESIKTARGELDERLAELGSVKKDLERLARSESELTSKVDQLEANSNLREVLEIERELRKESRAFRAETLAHLQRPLRRLADLAQRGEYPLGSDEREALSAFVKSPYKSFLSKSTGEYLTRILESMKKAIDSGKMEFKPKKTGRVLVQLNQLIGTTRLTEKQEKGRKLLTRRRELLRNAECKDMYEQRRGVLSKIDETKKEELEVRERMKSATSMTEAVNKRLIELLKLAETKTREYIGREVQLAGVSL